MDGFEFEILKREGASRLGRLKTPHGGFETPVFMPVGTNANVRLMKPSDLSDVGAEIILSNAFHLYLKPGLEVISRHGGLHEFMAWRKSILTDSGGFQVFSLNVLGISDGGVLVRSPVDGSPVYISPEISMEIQRTLRSDIAMAFDQCTSPDESREEVAEAVRRTSIWAERSLRSMEGAKNQAVFGIVQGGVFPDLRRISAKDVVSLDFDGYAIGGLSVGEPREITLDISKVVLEYLPEEKPRYFMGAGSPELILELVEMGVDMFDSVFPTRLARHGTALTRFGRLNLRSAVYRNDLSPIDETCDCYTCRTFTRSYVNHLFSKKETLGQILLTIHNIRFMTRFMKKIRENLKEGTFKQFKDEFLISYGKRR